MQSPDIAVLVQHSQRNSRVRRATPWVALAAGAVCLVWITFRIVDPLQGFDSGYGKAMSSLRESGVNLDRDITGRAITAHFEGVKRVDLAPLRYLPSLQSVDLFGTECTDEDLAALTALKDLRRLDLSSCPYLSDAGLTHLEGMKRLRLLNLRGTAVSDVGLRSLQSLEKLEVIQLFDTQVTSAGVAALRAALPGASVQWKLIPITAPSGLPSAPQRGTILLCSLLTPSIRAKFIELVGGPEARFVIVENGAFPQVDYRALSNAIYGSWPVTHLVIWHSNDTESGSKPEFLDDLRHANGIWFPGGYVDVFADPYVNSPAQAEFKALLDRGGVIGGESAGAVIQSTHAVMPSRNGFDFFQGFGFLKNMLVFPHVGQRYSLADFQQILVDHPGLAGIAMADGGAVIVHENTIQAFGDGTVGVLYPEASGEHWQSLTIGQRMSLHP